jgi:hypothetical protein
MPTQASTFEEKIRLNVIKIKQQVVVYRDYFKAKMRAFYTKARAMAQITINAMKQLVILLYKGLVKGTQLLWKIIKNLPFILQECYKLIKALGKILKTALCKIVQALQKAGKALFKACKWFIKDYLGTGVLILFGLSIATYEITIKTKAKTEVSLLSMMPGPVLLLATIGLGVYLAPMQTLIGLGAALLALPPIKVILKLFSAKKAQPQPATNTVPAPSTSAPTTAPAPTATPTFAPGFGAQATIATTQTLVVTTTSRLSTSTASKSTM